jgi:CMP-N-acetylneuraminic acid synthetase
MGSKALLQFARLGSTRLPRKLMRKVGSSTLAERGMQYISNLKGITPYLACPETDTELIELANRYNINVLPMDEQTSKADQWTNLIKPFIPILQQYDHVWDANILCHPFLRKKTGEFIIERMKYSFPVCFALRERNVLYNTSLEQINSCGQLANTKTNGLYYRPSHVGYVFPKKYLAYSEAELSREVIPVEIDLTKAEQIDIDTQDDLELAQAVGDYFHD